MLSHFSQVVDVWATQWSAAIYRRPPQEAEATMESAFRRSASGARCIEIGHSALGWVWPEIGGLHCLVADNPVHVALASIMSGWVVAARWC
jgi:hypothetical protein